MGILDACMKHALAQVKLMFGISILSWDTYDIINTQLHRGILPTLKIPKGLWATTTAVRDICDSVVHIYIYIYAMNPYCCMQFLCFHFTESFPNSPLFVCPRGIAPAPLLPHRTRSRVERKERLFDWIGKMGWLVGSIDNWMIYLYFRPMISSETHKTT